MYILIIIMLACSAFADFPYHTNTGNFNATTNATGDFNAFSWSWMGYDDQRVNVNLLPSGYAMVYMRMCYPRRGTIFLEITDGVLSGSNYTASVTRSNLPPNGVYFTEFIGFETASTSAVARSLATGMINIQHSLFENTTQSTWTNPAAGTVIGPPLHTLSQLSLWPFVQTNQMGTGATWTGTNWTFAGGSSGISASDATNIVTGVVAGYLPTSTVFVASESDPVWAGQSNSVVYTNNPALTDSRTPLAHSQDLASITDFVASAYASSNQGARADSAIQWGDAAVTNANTPLFWGTAGDISGIGVMMYGWYPVSFGDVHLRPLFGTSTATNSLDFFSDGTHPYFLRTDELGAHYRFYDTQWPPTATEVGASTTNHDHAGVYLVPSDTNSLPYGISSATSTSIALSVVAPWTNQVTASSVAAAGALTNAWAEPVLFPYYITATGGTGTLTRANGNCQALVTNMAVVITADATLTTNAWLSMLNFAISTGTNQVTWVTTAVTNTTTLSTTITNNILLFKGVGDTILRGQ